MQSTSKITCELDKRIDEFGRKLKNSNHKKPWISLSKIKSYFFYLILLTVTLGVLAIIANEQGEFHSGIAMPDFWKKSKGKNEFQIGNFEPRSPSKIQKAPLPFPEDKLHYVRRSSSGRLILTDINGSNVPFNQGTLDSFNHNYYRGRLLRMNIQGDNCLVNPANRHVPIEAKKDKPEIIRFNM